MYRDEFVYYEKDFKSLNEADEYFSSFEHICWLKETYGKQLPGMFIFKVNGKIECKQFVPTKQGIPMDWRFYAEYDKITSKDIDDEPNIEKRRLLIMEYGVNNYLQDVKELDSSHYGTLIEATIEDTRQKFVRVKNGTIEPPENRAYLREKGLLTLDNHKVYYIPVSDDVTTAKEGIEDSWGLPYGSLNSKWDKET